MIVAGYYGFTLDICPLCICPPSIRISFPDDNLNKHQWFSPNLVCAVILWRSGLGLLMGKFHQILTELSVRDTPIFSFPDDTLSKCQGILNLIHAFIWKRSCLGLLMGKFRQWFTALSARYTIMAGCYTLMFLFTSENTVSFHCVKIPLLFISDIQWFHYLH